ncbi:MAG: methyltransferase domain-containing protein [Paracoccaceae bacterium]
MQRIPDPRRAPFRKRVEWFFSGIARIGETYRLAKLSRRAIEEDAQRAAALEDDLAHRLDAASDAADHRLYALSEEVDAKLDALDARRAEDAAQRIDAARDDLGHRLAAAAEHATAHADSAVAALGQRIEGEIAGRLAALEGAVGIGHDGAETLRARLDRLEARLDDRLGEIERRVDARLDATAGRLAETRARFAAETALAARGLTDLGRRLDLLRRSPPPAPEPAEGRDLEDHGLEALLDAFYNRLEDRFRGSREEIMRRLAVYLPAAEAAARRTGGAVLDLGCGRGEWLELLGRRGVTARGVDLNPVQIQEARAEGLDATLDDACDYLAREADGSLAMVTAHHLVEHLPFRTTAWIAREALAKLAPGGLLVFETPNPANLLVGAKSFHMDPTHRRPLPAEVLSTLLDTVGYHPVETRAMHPHERLAEFERERRLDPEIAGLLFGPQDLAVIATKPDPAGAASGGTGSGGSEPTIFDPIPAGS